MLSIKSDVVEQLQKYIAACQKNTDYELECKIKYCTNSEMISHQFENRKRKDGDLPRNYFDRAMKFLMAQSHLKQDFQDESLDINTGEYRITISDLDEIMEYINNDRWDDQSDNVTVIKTKRKIDRYEFPGLNLVFDVKQESTVDNTSELYHTVAASKNYYRLKKRWTFKDLNFKYDLTIVKSSKHQSNTFKASDCLGHGNTFEVEVEFIGKSGSTNAKEYLRSCLQLYAVMYGEANLITSDEKFRVARDFCQVKIKIFRLKDTLDLPSLQDLTNIMVGPKPITLERAHLRAPGLGIASVLEKEKYTVTPKADGERCLIWIDSHGKVYLIDSSSVIKWTGITVHGHALTLIDGELVTEKKKCAHQKSYQTRSSP